MKMNRDEETMFSEDDFINIYKTYSFLCLDFP